MFKSEEQINVFVDKVEKFVDAAIYHALLSHQGLNESAQQMAALLNKRRSELENFIATVSGIGPATNTTDTYLCPDCGGEMALRTNRQNGDKFYGCKKYPNCRGTRDSSGLSRAEREEQKYKTEQVAQEGGFSFNRDKRSPSTEVSPPVETGWINPFAKK